MLDRCLNENSKSFHHYGGRGINVCARWMAFESFLADMGERPTDKHSIDRYPNNDGDYEPSNCRWATMKDQSRNTRRNVFLEFNGERRCVAEWAEVQGLSVNVLRARLYVCKWPVERALTTPLDTSRSNRKGISHE